LIVGVPLVLDDPPPMEILDGDNDWQPFKDFIHGTRININARQVFPSGFDPIEAFRELKHDNN
jgi:alkylated DNA repair protein alkB family protein 1